MQNDNEIKKQVSNTNQPKKTTTKSWNRILKESNFEKRHEPWKRQVWSKRNTYACKLQRNDRVKGNNKNMTLKWKLRQHIEEIGISKTWYHCYVYAWNDINKKIQKKNKTTWEEGKTLSPITITKSF